MSLASDLEDGIGSLPLGFRLLATPGVPALLAIPFAITFVVYGTGLALTLPPLLDWLGGLTEGSPQWVLDWFGWLISVLQFLLGALLVLVIGWVGVLLAGILAGPFYGQISAKVEARLTGRTPGVERGFLAELAAGMKRELQKLAWALPRVLALLLLGFVPGLNVITSPLSFVFGAWVMAVQFADFSPENRGIEFPDARRALSERRALVLGFGLPTAFGIGVPLLNLLVAPAAVAGGTALWLRATGEWDGRLGL
ncbi:MAG: sulfate transporter CysZ [Pseudomonadales bacterium]|jgi:CysZ protein|nr:sulfate transporter CysZ [Pseudomonadales bacterium]